MGDESSGERDIAVMKAAEKEILEESSWIGLLFKQSLFPKFECLYHPSLSDKSAIFSDVYRETFQLSFYANKPATYYTTFGKEENQKLHIFIGWSGLYFCL